ncbi:hypothetical protein D3C75_758580 [compost metagenome]
MLILISFFTKGFKLAFISTELLTGHVPLVKQENLFHVINSLQLSDVGIDCGDEIFV